MGQIARVASSGFQAHLSMVVSRRAGSSLGFKRRHAWCRLVRVAVGFPWSALSFQSLCSCRLYTPRLSRPAHLSVTCTLPPSLPPSRPRPIR